MATGKLNVYLVRHGKTMFNTSRRVQGWSDTPLTNEGIEVAEFLGRGLREIPFDAVYTSDRGRTIETAGIVLRESNQAHLEINELRAISVNLVSVSSKGNTKILCLEE